MEALLNLITHLGVPAILLVIFAESGLLIGFLLPGDSLLFTSGFLVQQNILHINIHLFVFLLSLAAILGDSTGYAFGKKIGRKLFERENSKFFRKEHLVQAENFYKKHGSLTIILARFVPVVRTFAPIIAGVSNMPYKTFLMYNIVGGVAWSALFTYLGFYAGKFLHDLGINVEIAAIAVILISISPMVLHAVMGKNNREKLIAGTKRQLSILFSDNKKQPSKESRANSETDKES